MDDDNDNRVECTDGGAHVVNDPFALLPFEIILAVVRHLASAIAVCRLATVSRAIHLVQSDPLVWRTSYAALSFVHPGAEPLAHGRDWLWLCRARATPALHRGRCVGTATYREGRLVYHGEILDGLPHGYGIMVTAKICGVRRATVVRTERSLVLGSTQSYEPGGWFEGTWEEGLLANGRCAYSQCGKGAKKGFEGRLRQTLSEFDLVYEHDGVCRYSDGRRYMGTMHAGKRHGRGIMVWPDGKWHYDGEWNHDNRHGRGTMHFTNDQHYDGEWKDDSFHGRGTYTYGDGSRYEGQWKKGSKHGHGVLKVADGDRYDGHWRLGQAHGSGIYTFANGTRHTGSWVEGKHHGHGTEVDVRGFTFEGNYADNRRNGYGVWTNVDGSRYKGEWKDGEKNGRGAMVYAGCGHYDGEWKGGFKNGSGVMVYADGVRYDGQWKDNRYHGRGTWTDADGNRYEGQWKDGLRDGYGDMTYVDGDLYRGEWRRGRRGGYGVLVCAGDGAGNGGARYDGDWKEGDLCASPIDPRHRPRSPRTLGADTT